MTIASCVRKGYSFYLDGDYVDIIGRHKDTGLSFYVTHFKISTLRRYLRSLNMSLDDFFDKHSI